MSNLFGNDLTTSSTSDNGPILNNIAKQAVVTESVLTLLPDDTVSAVHISPYGKSILNETSVSSLRNKILDADTAIEITDNGVGEVNFEVDNVLKMQVTSANTKINNNLIVDTTLTANTSITTPTVISSKIHFDGDDYLQHSSGVLNMFLNNNHNFVADTGNDKSSYEFKIDDISVLKMTRDLTSNPALPNNRTQVSSEEILLRDDGIAGGSLTFQRTGPSQIFTGYINYYVNDNGPNRRLFYTGFNSGPTRGSPLHFMENICKSYTFKNSLGNIMKIVSYDSNLDATSNYVEIHNKLICPILNSTNIRLTGESTDAIELKSDEIRLKNLYILNGQIKRSVYREGQRTI
jgi:hypothetical protein